jgi:formyltetrahydrofolate hydrolase
VTPETKPQAEQGLLDRLAGRFDLVVLARYMQILSEDFLARVTHDDTVEALIQVGRDIERTVLARAVRWHLEDRVLVHENRIVVFR